MSETTKQLLAWISGAVVFMAPLAYAVLRLLVARAELARLEVEKAKGALLKADATDAAFYAEEAAASGMGIDKAKMAHDIVADKHPERDDDEIEIAVKAAVGATPGLGATGKKNGVH